MRSARLTYAVILSGAAAWCALIVLAPAAASSAGGAPLLAPLGTILYAFFSPLCHQIGARSFQLFGSPLAVCARCSGVYFGFLAGTVAYPVARKLLRNSGPGSMFLILALAPMLVDVMLETAGLHESSMGVRAVTGAWCGTLVPFLIIPGAIEGVAQLLSRRNSHAVQTEKGIIDA